MLSSPHATGLQDDGILFMAIVVELAGRTRVSSHMPAEQNTVAAGT
jgi:hypothetical protein